MNKPMLTLILAASVVTPWAAEVAKPESFELKGNAQAYFLKRTWEDGKTDFLDKGYMRAHLGAKFAAEDLEAEFSLRMFSPTFGIQVLDEKKVKSGAAAVDTAKNSVSARAVDFFYVDKAMVQYNLGMTKVKFGRWSTDFSVSGHLGNYLDQEVDTNKTYLARTMWHDAVEVSVTTGPVVSSLMLGVKDSKVNSGYVRLVETLKLKQVPALVVDAGYRANLLDSISRDNDATYYHRMFTRIQYTIMPGLVPYVEAAMVDALDSKGNLVEKQQCPVAFGTQIPTFALKNTKVWLEAEYVKNRVIKGEDRPLDWNLAVEQKMGKRTKLQLTIHSDATAAAASDVEVGGRITAAFP